MLQSLPCLRTRKSIHIAVEIFVCTLLSNTSQTLSAKSESSQGKLTIGEDETNKTKDDVHRHEFTMKKNLTQIMLIETTGRELISIEPSRTTGHLNESLSGLVSFGVDAVSSLPAGGSLSFASSSSSAVEIGTEDLFSTGTDFSDSAPTGFPMALRATATFICTLVLILGLTGNILVPYVVFCTKELRNSTNLFLINLSIADLLVLMVCAPTVLFELHSKPEIWVLGEAMCKVVPFVEMSVAHGSILTMIAISFERYYAICKPLKAGYKCTKFRALVIILVVWVVAITSTLPILLIAEQVQTAYIDGSMVSVCITNANTTWQSVYFILVMVAFFWSPLLVLVVVYVVIARRLCKDDTRNSGMVVVSSQVISECAQMRARRQVVFMLAVVIASFFVCLLPFRLLTIWLIVSSEDQVKELGMEAYYTLLYACRIMLYLNSAINPILYNLISSKFRDAFVSAIFCKRSNRLLARHSTFNTTTSSSGLMSSLKSSLQKKTHQTQQAQEHLQKQRHEISQLGHQKSHNGNCRSPAFKVQSLRQYEEESIKLRSSFDDDNHYRPQAKQSEQSIETERMIPSQESCV